MALLLAAATGARAQTQSVTFTPQDVFGYNLYGLAIKGEIEMQIWRGEYYGYTGEVYLYAGQYGNYPLVVEASAGYAITSVVLQTSTHDVGTPQRVQGCWTDEMNHIYYDNVEFSGTTPGSTVTVTPQNVRSGTEISCVPFLELTSVTVNYTNVTYTVSYDANGGSNPPNSHLKAHDGELMLQGLGGMTRTGYMCDGWAMSPDGPKVYDLGGTYTANSDATLYAHWNMEEYSITYDLRGGTLATPNPTTYNVNSASITLNNPTREGYLFVGWTGSNSSTPETSVTIPTGSAGNRYYTANWWNENMELTNNSENSSAIIAAAASGLYSDVTLTGRTLYRDGSWNTICLPFGIGNLTGTPLEGFTVKTLTSTSYNDGTLTMNFSGDLTSIEAGKPYIVKNGVIISSAADWNTFAQNVTNGNTYKGKVVRLAADISVSTLAGAASRPFKGTFDGCGHTLTVNLTATDTYCAPFRNLDGATIQNLVVAGNIGTGKKYAAGMAGETSGATTIKNCRSSVAISSTAQGVRYLGGLVGSASGSLNITNCLFDGQLIAPSSKPAFQWGGFVGSGTVSITNSLFAPTAVSVGNNNGGHLTFCPNSGTVSNCYYTQTLGTAQGTNASGMSNETLVSNLGNGWKISGGKVVPKTDVSSDIHNPVFNDVLVSTATANVSTDYVDFEGTYSLINIAGEDRSILFLGANNTLYYPNAAMQIGACRAYFRLKGITAGDPTAGVRAFVMNFGEDEATSIHNSQFIIHNEADAWYSLDGSKLSGKPTVRGIYINNGRKIIIK